MQTDTDIECDRESYESGWMNIIDDMRSSEVFQLAWLGPIKKKLVLAPPPSMRN